MFTWTTRTACSVLPILWTFQQGTAPRLERHDEWKRVHMGDEAQRGTRLGCSE